MLKQYTEDQVILLEGKKDLSLYKIISGKVVASINHGKPNETIIGILSSGAYFGEIGAFTNAPSIYSAVAYEDCLIMEITKDEMDEYAKLNYRDLLAIMSNMASSMVKMKTNIDLLNKDITSLLNDRDNAKNRAELKDRIKKSDITKQLIQYQIQMGIRSPYNRSLL